MADPARARRLAKRISEIVATAIEYEIKDPRLAGVTITDSKVTNDLHDATLYYTVLGTSLEEEPDYAGAEAGLSKATGVLRSKVGAALGVRFTPTLASVIVTPVSRGSLISNSIAEATMVAIRLASRRARAGSAMLRLFAGPPALA